jgi:hypothetical protein
MLGFRFDGDILFAVPPAVKTRTKHILWLTPLGVAGAYAACLVSLRAEPSGYVASYSVLPHSSTDVLDFSRGTVTLRTCCGDEPWGTYTRSREGAWIWHLRQGKKSVTKEYLVHSNFLSMSFTDMQDPSSKFTLRRRVFTHFPL